jgi:hypothetical protein
MPDREVSAEMTKADYWEVQADMWHQNWKEADDEIEKLREALRSIASNTCCDRCQEAALVARAALKEKE